MTIQDVLHKRVLIGVASSAFSQKDHVEEVLILEVSPSERWAKIQNINGGKFWKLASSLQIIEVLNSIKKGE